MNFEDVQIGQTIIGKGMDADGTVDFEGTVIGIDPRVRQVSLIMHRDCSSPKFYRDSITNKASIRYEQGTVDCCRVKQVDTSSLVEMKRTGLPPATKYMEQLGL